jgi:hypothetical protein
MIAHAVNTGVANACVRTKGAALPDENFMIGLTLSLDSPQISGDYRENMEGQGEFAMAMIGEQRIHFLRGIRADYRQYKQMLATVDVEKSE